MPLFQKPRCGWFASHKTRALDYERELHHNKVMECVAIRKENEALRETVVKQRMALDALREANRADSRRMTDQVAALRHQVDVLTQERNRYRAVLRRNFPTQLEAIET